MAGILPFRSVQKVVRSLINIDAALKRQQNPDKYTRGLLHTNRTSRDAVEVLRQHLEDEALEITKKAADVAAAYGRRTIHGMDMKSAITTIFEKKVFEYNTALAEEKDELQELGEVY